MPKTVTLNESYSFLGKSKEDRTFKVLRMGEDSNLYTLIYVVDNKQGGEWLINYTDTV